MNVLVACEESQRVCMAFREKGHNAFSCDILPCSGGHPEWHIQGDVLAVLNGRCGFETADGTTHNIDEKWDLIIAHPPCTHLTGAGACNIPKHFNLPKYNQLVRPYMFGESNNKPICLWLKGVEELKPTNIVEKDKDIVRWVHKATGKKKSCSKWYNTNTSQHSKHRSKTFESFALAMAEQWG